MVNRVEHTIRSWMPYMHWLAARGLWLSVLILEWAPLLLWYRFSRFHNLEGMTVLYTTHYMEEAAELSHHIAIMDKGRVIAYGTHDELIKMVGEQTRIDITLNVEAEKVLPAWQKIEGVSKIDATDGTVTALVDDSNRVLPRSVRSRIKGGCTHHVRGYSGAKSGNGVPASHWSCVEGLI